MDVNSIEFFGRSVLRESKGVACPNFNDEPDLTEYSGMGLNEAAAAAVKGAVVASCLRGSWVFRLLEHLLHRLAVFELHYVRHR